MDKTWTLVEPASAFKRRLGQDAIFTLGNGYYLGVTMRERQGARFWGLVIGHSLDAAR